MKLMVAQRAILETAAACSPGTVIIFHTSAAIKDVIHG